MPKSKRQQRADRLSRYLYPNYQNDQMVFAADTKKRLRRGQRILDVGAGRGRVKWYDWSGEGRQVVGVDLDPRVSTHPNLSFGTLGSAYALPFRDSCFDVCISTAVLEHLAEPELAFREVARVLKPAGWFLAIMPNLFSYPATVARATPHWFHQLMTGKPEDTFPTYYRANRIKTISALARDAGLELVDYERFMGRPGYVLAKHWLPFLITHVLHRFIDRCLPFCYGVLMVRLQKPE